MWSVVEWLRVCGHSYSVIRAFGTLEAGRRIAPPHFNSFD